jgi:hypothetical protein
MLLKNPDVAWSDIPDLPKAACALLEQQFSRCTSTVLRCQQSTGGDTTKLLIQLQDGMQVEAVVMHYDTSGGYWNELCYPRSSSSSSSSSSPVQVMLQAWWYPSSLLAQQPSTLTAG